MTLVESAGNRTRASQLSGQPCWGGGVQGPGTAAFGKHARSLPALLHPMCRPLCWHSGTGGSLSLHTLMHPVCGKCTLPLTCQLCYNHVDACLAHVWQLYLMDSTQSCSGAAVHCSVRPGTTCHVTISAFAVLQLVQFPNEGVKDLCRSHLQTLPYVHRSVSCKQLICKPRVRDVVQIISENLALDQFMPPAQRSALNAAKHWMAQEWPRYFGLKPLARDGFLAPAVFLSGSNNNTSNPVHRREKHGRRSCCAALCCALALLCVAQHCAMSCCGMLCLPCAAPLRCIHSSLQLQMHIIQLPAVPSSCRWNLSRKSDTRQAPAGTVGHPDPSGHAKLFQTIQFSQTVS